MMTEPQKDNLVTTPEQQNRKLIWNQVEREFLAKNVEPGILKLVIGLNLAGCRSFVSCEGHRERCRLERIPNGPLYERLASPYVAFSGRVERVQNTSGMKRVLTSLDEFYKERKTDPKFRIVLSKYSEYNTKISSGGIDTVDIQDLGHPFQEGENLANEWIIGQKREMLDFADFLEQTYYETGFLDKDSARLEEP
jgi:hypothetical protein